MAVAALAVSGSMIIGLAVNEGYKANAYPDSGNVWTIGFGETKGVKQGDTTTPQRALMVLGKSVDGYAKGVQSCVTAPLYQYEFDALVDAAYNSGAGAVCKSPMVHFTNLQQYESACESYKTWHVHDHEGHFVQGLVNRRQKEYQMCIGAKP
ncbi:lysozyme [Polynucleobacter sp.]|uniref:lysozyme n=1 Tax=Polynucleobacter sp. TaxID=2029855 RepID=UPI003F69C6C4